MRKSIVTLAALALMVLCTPSCSKENPSSMSIGIHLQACDYSFTGKDLLDEGSDEVLNLGAEGIGIYMGPEYREYYNGVIEDAVSLESLARTTAYRRLFDKLLRVYSLTCYAFADGLDSHWQMGIESYDPQASYREIRALAEYLLCTYRGTGKVFIIKNWEGDWHLLGGYDQKAEPTDEAVAAMTTWLNARCHAVEDAKQAVADHKGVEVYSAVEFNLVAKAEQGGRTVLNAVVPQVKADLYSYSSWDSAYQPDKIIPRLDFIKRFAPDSPSFGSRNVMLGEIGAPDGREDKVVKLRWSLEAARNWGVPFCFFWQLYDNECGGKRYYPASAAERKSLECRGFWLIDSFGRRTPSWYMLRDFINSGKRR
jgi:hypothetical protein